MAIDLDDVGTGALDSIVTYLWTFVSSIEGLPRLQEQVTSFRDLWTRIAQHFSPATA